MKLTNLHKTSNLDLYSANTDTSLEIPLVDEGIKVCFRSPASDFLDLSIDLNKKNTLMTYRYVWRIAKME